MIDPVEAEKRRVYKDSLSEMVEFTVSEELGLWSAVKTVARGVAKAGRILTGGDNKKDEDEGSSGDWDESEHPRGPDGRFVEGSKGATTTKKEDAAVEKEIAEQEKALKEAKVKKWESAKYKYEEAQKKKLNKQIQIIQISELNEAERALNKARANLKRDDLSDDEIEENTKAFKEANKKVKEINAKIKKLRPKPYNVPKP